MNRRRAAPAAIAAHLLLGAALAPGQVRALPFEVNDDIRGVWNNRVAMAVAVRADDPDKQLVGFNNRAEYPGARGAVGVNDDGNLNYRKHDVVAAPIVYTTDLELRYRNRFGFYGKLRSWYDYSGDRGSVPHGSIGNGYRPDQKLDDSDYYSYNKFDGVRVLDLYLYGNWSIDTARLTARVGQQTINWGESLLHTGINAFNPIDFSALGRPGVRQDDALVPVNRIYTNLITRNGISLEAFYALDWEQAHLPPCGSINQAVDILADPGCYAATSGVPLSDREQFDLGPLSANPALVPRTSLPKPGAGGQYGLSSRYFVEALDTEFGLYYTRFHSTLPVLDLALCPGGWQDCDGASGLELKLNYHEDVEAFAISAATGVRNIALSGELSQFRNLPVQRNFPELIAGATLNEGIYAARMRQAGDGTLFAGSWKADRTQLLLGGQIDLSSALSLIDASLAFEAAGQWVDNLPDTGEERIGRQGNWGAAMPPGGSCQAVTRQTQGGCKVDGFATDFSWGYRLFATISLPRPARGVDLYPLLGWNHDVQGYSVDGAQLQGRRTFTLKLRAVYQRALFLELGRSWIKSTTNYDPARDKGVYTLAVGLQL
ncbi:MAG: DUF1302 family protein [Halieaceae bacterium]|nr:DUF1302 family protein [Halieaceae bacterium]MCP5147713.1 DUF1302 family protein [Pseudomonadales bacterium]MCP5167424.1 DUF1302 family protein [Pseudomonadales bacterium]MCP5187001.1 DUF1302 family protein [Pseudomonadales bacterium]